MGKTDKELRNAFLIGLGVTVLTAEAIEKRVKALAKQHNITSVEAKKAARLAVKKAKRHAMQISAEVRKAEREMHTAMKKTARAATSRDKTRSRVR
ncbi:MAG: hypothetical protein ABIH41_05900 [Nanoarchaeota archaeon]